MTIEYFQSPAGRRALLMRSVESAFALLLTKATKPRLSRNGLIIKGA